MEMEWATALAYMSQDYTARRSSIRPCTKLTSFWYQLDNIATADQPEAEYISLRTAKLAAAYNALDIDSALSMFIDEGLDYSGYGTDLPISLLSASPNNSILTADSQVQWPAHEEARVPFLSHKYVQYAAEPPFENSCCIGG
jgi:hypothetical protein